MAVFIRNAANLTHLLLKGKKFGNGKKAFYFDEDCPFKGIILKYTF
jgi:hypothetical protein